MRGRFGRSRSVLPSLGGTKYDIPVHDEASLRRAVASVIARPRPARILITQDILITSTISVDTSSPLILEAQGFARLRVAASITPLFSIGSSTNREQLTFRNIKAEAQDGTYIALFLQYAGNYSEVTLDECRLLADQVIDGNSKDTGVLRVTNTTSVTTSPGTAISAGGLLGVVVSGCLLYGDVNIVTGLYARITQNLIAGSVDTSGGSSGVIVANIITGGVPTVDATDLYIVDATGGTTEPLNV